MIRYNYAYVDVQCPCGGTRQATGTILPCAPGYMCWACDQCQAYGHWAMGYDGSSFFPGRKEAAEFEDNQRRLIKERKNKLIKRVLVLGTDLL